jgi:hypothetical protein
MTGPQLRQYLQQFDIDPQIVVCERDSGQYIADWYVPEMKAPVWPAEVYADMLRAVLPGVRIVNTIDTIAAWRDDQPVINAMVRFAWATGE